jgi:cation diffusion facilitator family transporter
MAVDMHPAKESFRPILFSISVSLSLALVKAVAGTVGHSYALIADAIESLSDVFSSLVVYIGLRVAIRPPDADHPYGHGKAEPMAATVVALVLFGAGVAIAIESVHEIRTPHQLPHRFTLGVLAIVVLVKELLFRYIQRAGESAKSVAIKNDAWHHRADAITSGLAFVGISVALIGGPGWESADDWAALLASGIIMFNAYLLLRPAVAELADTAPGIEMRDQVCEVARSVPGVVALDKCIVRKMGFDYYVDIHVIVDSEMSVREGHEVAHAVKDALRQSHPQVADVLVHIEPSEH